MLRCEASSQPKDSFVRRPFGAMSQSRTMKYVSMAVAEKRSRTLTGPTMWASASKGGVAKRSTCASRRSTSGILKLVEGMARYECEAGGGGASDKSCVSRASGAPSARYSVRGTAPGIGQSSAASQRSAPRSQ